MKRRKKVLLLVLCLALLACSLGGCEKLFFPSLDSSSSEMVTYDGSVYEPSENFESNPNSDIDDSSMVSSENPEYYDFGDDWLEDFDDEPEPSYSYLNDAGFEYTYGFDIWAEISGYNFSEGAVWFNNGEGDYHNAYDYKFSDGFLTQGNILKSDTDDSLNFHEKFSDSHFTYTVTSNNTLTFHNGKYGTISWIILERVVDEERGYLVFKCENFGENWYVPAALIDWSRSPEKIDDKIYYYFLQAE